jgi:cation:H+ antiporter
LTAEALTEDDVQGYGVTSSWPLAANLALFAVEAALVWLGGVKLSAHAKAIANRTGAGQAFVGIVLLGGIVSLPEMATSVAAARLGNAGFAVSTLLGGIAATMVIMAVTDIVTGREALSTDIAHPIVLLDGVLVIVFLTLTACAMIVGDVSVAGVGLWTSALFGLYLFAMFFLKRHGSDEPWVPRDKRPAEAKRRTGEQDRQEDRSLLNLSLRMAGSAGIILGAGVGLALTGDALAQQTGLGAGFIGMLLGGMATSLPEVTTTVAAVRMAQYEMAFADAFGTNLFSVMLLFAVDLAYAGGPVLNEVDRFSIVGTLLGILLTGLYLAGFVERRHKAVLRMGIDSLIVLATYIGGMVLLYSLG